MAFMTRILQAVLHWERCWYPWFCWVSSIFPIITVAVVTQVPLGRLPSGGHVHPDNTTSSNECHCGAVAAQRAGKGMHAPSLLFRLLTTFALTDGFWRALPFPSPRSADFPLSFPPENECEVHVVAAPATVDAVPVHHRHSMAEPGADRFPVHAQCVASSPHCQ